MVSEKKINYKVKISIQTKLLFFFVSLVFFSIGIFLYFALDLFYTDKAAYVFDTSFEKTEQIAKDVTTSVRNYEEDALDLLTIFHLSSVTEVFQGHLKQKSHFLSFDLYGMTAENAWQKIYGKADKKPVSKEFLSEIRNRKHKVKFYLQDQSPYITLGIYHPGYNQIILAKVDGSFIRNLFNSALFKGILIDNNHQFLLGQDPALNQKELTEFIYASKVDQGVYDISLKQESYLMAFHKNPELGIIIATLIPKSKAFSAAKALINKSYAIALLIISLGVAFGVFVSRSITKPIDSLMEGTRKISSGDFESQVMVNTSDELAVLSDSFNLMTSKIIGYMEEVKDKVRMENELAVAQLVQSSFFPNKNLKFGKFVVSGYYQSASECGGDWWGSFKIQDKNLILIGDATGHGVPAALVTATVNCCSLLLKELSATRPEILESPASILEIMNEVVYKLGGKILMTFFIGIHDEAKNLLTYSNASHNPPFVYRYKESMPEREDILLLDEVNGHRLGHKIESNYHNARINFHPKDVIVLYTDGVTESENRDGKQYGERRFIKSLLKVAKSSPEEILNSVIEDAFHYYEHVVPNDDVTLVVAKFG